MVQFSLENAEKILDAALRKGRELSLSPLTVAVLDAGGHIIALRREDGSGILRVQIATGKAWCALGMGYNSRELATRAQKIPNFVGALGSVSEGRMVPAAGGLLVLDGEKQVIGAVGISGDTSDNDEICGIYAITVTGLACLDAPNS
jgi:uncharacterized protein GlcG (DUF336 family)